MPMAYREQYYPQQSYAQGYTDSPEYNPYSQQQSSSRYPAPVYQDPSPVGYSDDENVAPKPSRSRTLTKEGREPYDPGFSQSQPVNKGDFTSWRREHYVNYWTQGSRGRCVGRFCCCSIFLVLFFFLSIILTLGIWILPPNITVNNVGLPETGSAFQVTSNSLNLNLGVNISVINPNYFSVAFSQIKADLTYPINNTNVGGGQQKNIVFPSHTDKTFTFPFQLTYVTANDPTKAVLTDLLTKCGIVGGKKTDITVNYKITLGIRILFVTVSPSFSNNFSFECPLSANDLQALLQGTGISIGSLGG